MVQMSKTKGPSPGPERALRRGQARLDQRVVERRGEHGLALRATGCPTRTTSRCSRHASGGRLAPGGEARPARPAVAVEVLARLLDAAQREADAQLDGLPGPRRARPHQPERAQRGRADVVEVEPGAAGHQAAVVPEHLPPLVVVALDVDGERRALDDDLALGDPGREGLQVGAQRDGARRTGSPGRRARSRSPAGVAVARGRCTGGPRSSARRSSRTVMPEESVAA